MTHVNNPTDDLQRVTYPRCLPPRIQYLLSRRTHVTGYRYTFDFASIPTVTYATGGKNIPSSLSTRFKRDPTIPSAFLLLGNRQNHPSR